MGKRQVSSPLLAAMTVPHMGMEPSVPTHRQREREAAHSEKLHATREWVGGRISTKKHSMIHSRANKVLKGVHMKGRR